MKKIWWFVIIFFSVIFLMIVALGILRGIGSAGKYDDFPEKRIEEQIKQQVMEHLRTSGEKIYVRESVQMGANDLRKSVIGVQNLKLADINLKIVITEQLCNGDGSYALSLEENEVSLSLYESKGITLTIENENSINGSCSYKASLIHQNGELYAEKQFFVSTRS